MVRFSVPVSPMRRKSQLQMPEAADFTPSASGHEQTGLPLLCSWLIHCDSGTSALHCTHVSGIPFGLAPPFVSAWKRALANRASASVALHSASGGSVLPATVARSFVGTAQLYASPDGRHDDAAADLAGRAPSNNSTARSTVPQSALPSWVRHIASEKLHLFLYLPWKCCGEFAAEKGKGGGGHTNSTLA